MKTMLTVEDLFSGIGGFSLGLERTGGFVTTSFCEIDPACQMILGRHWRGVPCHPDIRTRQFVRGSANVLAGGFPCQDLSYAGKRAGLAGERSGLFWQMVRAIRLVRPDAALLENVAALLTGGMGDVLGSMATDRYDAEWDCISASDAGAPHGRARIWIAFTNTDCEQRPPGRHSPLRWWERSAQEAGEATEPPRYLGAIWRQLVDGAARAFWSDDWEAKFEAFRRMDDGLPTRLDVDREAAAIQALGNTVIPQIPELWGNAYLAALGLKAVQSERGTRTGEK